MTINDQKVFISDLKITKNYETKFRNGFVLMKSFYHPVGDQQLKDGALRGLKVMVVDDQELN